MLNYAFIARELHSVMLVLYEFNLAGRRACEQAGFQEFGRRQQCRMMGGRLREQIYMDCIATEFESPLLGRIFVADEQQLQ